jgi:hypothetical protein
LVWRFGVDLLRGRAGGRVGVLGVGWRLFWRLFTVVLVAEGRIEQILSWIFEWRAMALNTVRITCLGALTGQFPENLLDFPRCCLMI